MKLCKLFILEGKFKRFSGIKFTPRLFYCRNSLIDISGLDFKKECAPISNFEDKPKWLYHVPQRGEVKIFYDTNECDKVRRSALIIPGKLLANIRFLQSQLCYCSFVQNNGHR